MLTINQQIPRVFKPAERKARYKGVFGGRGCVHPDTVIDTPNGPVKICEFDGGEVYSYHDGKIYTALATKPKSYTEEQLYLVTLQDGRQISVTDQHKFLTNRGWIECRHLSMSDGVFVSHEQERPYHFQTSSGSSLLELPPDVRHCFEKLSDYPDHYSLYHHQCGQQPQPGVSTYRSFSQQPSGGRQRSYRALMHTDDLASLSCNHDRPILVGIKSICKHDRLVYWDLHVPYFENYLSNGIVNHNSGKSHNRAEALIIDSLESPGLRSVCIREVQKTLKQSSKLLLEDKLKTFKLGNPQGFKVFNEVIETPGDGVVIFQGMQDHTAESIKSLEGFQRAWVEEAQTLSSRSLSLLRPTIRADDSELWFTWNPRHKNDAVDAFLRGPLPPTDAIVIKANWSDNPFFPKSLQQERLDCLSADPMNYDHIWEGGYATAIEGAYFAKELTQIRLIGQIGHVAADPLLTIRLFMDIGGTGAKADAFAIWAVQFVGKEIRVLNYYEAQGQPIQAHLEWLRSQGYTPGKADVWLPHDGETNDRIFDVSYRSAFEQAGYDVEVVPRQGKGAAMMRVEAVRRWLPSCWFDEEKTRAGVEALAWYHEKRDEIRGIGLGPDHDWASHGADAFGLMAVVAGELQEKAKPRTPEARTFTRQVSWMS